MFVRKLLFHLKDDPKEILVIILNHLACILPDRLFIKLKFRLRNGYWPNLAPPITYNEKLQWLKLNDQNPEYTKLVDKAEVKDYVASIIGQDYIIPTLGIWNNVEEIDWNSLPNQFVIKNTNDSGGLVVCKDKDVFDVEKAKEKLKKGASRNYTSITKEYPYKDVPRRFIAEEYKEDEYGELRDYKFFCFNGEPKMIFVATGRQKGATTFDFYDINWNHLDIQNEYPNKDGGIPKPSKLSEMIDVARKLSSNIPHVRVDLYFCNNQIYFGEMTFFHNSGFYPWKPSDWDYKLGSYLKL